jgi:diadenosine tetraphosphate (Ap4A) HIT family hydrolase
MQDKFTLDSRLAADTLRVGDLPLSRVLLMNDRRYRWVILVPRRAGITEWMDLDEADGIALWRESMQLGRVLRDLYGGRKLNIGALGNLVPQLHVHHVVRHEDDPAWPGPVWGHSVAEPYGDREAAGIVEELRSALL